MSPRYVLDAHTATAHFPGIGRYVVNLALAMAPLLAPEEHLTLLRDPTQPSPWDLPALAGKRVRVVDVSLSLFSLRQQWAIPRLLARLEADLYHSPYYLMPYRPGAPAALTVYDIIPIRFPAQSTLGARSLFRWTTGMALQAMQHILAIFEATCQDFAHHFHISPERITTIPLAADPAFFPRPPAEIDTVRRRCSPSERFVLYVGSNKPHKNLTRLVEAWAQMTEYGIRNTLVIAGLWAPRYPEPRCRAEQLGVENIRWLGPVPEADLFVFPSLYEGFGLPVLAAMERALTDQALWASLRARGLERARRFTWEETARRTLEVYRRVMQAA